MKALSNVQVSVKDGKVTMTADIIEKTFEFPVQRVTVGWLHPTNPRHPRSIQISQEAFFVKAFGEGFAFEHEDLVALAAAVNPKTAAPPMLTRDIKEDLIADVGSELHPDFQWQYGVIPATKGGGPLIWQDIAGQTSKSLPPDAIPQNAYAVRAVIKSDAGSITSNPIRMAKK